MDCEKVRDRFSSLLEGELDPLEEEKVRKHLTSCADCQREWERFDQMVRWLHSIEEEEVPEGFLSEVEKKVQERKLKGQWLGSYLFRSMKIPIQAVAMVFIIFLAFYLTKMTPFEMVQKRLLKRRKSLLQN